VIHGEGVGAAQDEKKYQFCSIEKHVEIRIRQDNCGRVGSTCSIDTIL